MVVVDEIGNGGCFLWLLVIFGIFFSLGDSCSGYFLWLLVVIFFFSLLVVFVVAISCGGCCWWWVWWFFNGFWWLAWRWHGGGYCGCGGGC